MSKVLQPCGDVKPCSVSGLMWFGRTPAGEPFQGGGIARFGGGVVVEHLRQRFQVEREREREGKIRGGCCVLRVSTLDLVIYSIV